MDDDWNDTDNEDTRAMRNLDTARQAWIDAERTMYHAIKTARWRGHSWAMIGALFGTTRQAAQERYARLERIYAD